MAMDITKDKLLSVLETASTLTDASRQLGFSGTASRRNIIRLANRLNLDISHYIDTHQRKKLQKNKNIERNCLQCSSITTNAKFCSNVCVAKYNIKRHINNANYTELTDTDYIIAARHCNTIHDVCKYLRIGEYHNDIVERYKRILAETNNTDVAELLERRRLWFQKRESPEGYLKQVLVYTPGKRQRYSKYRDKLIQAGWKTGECERCGIVEYRGQKIKLDFHHIDGDYHNNVFENIQLLCYSCHTQTENYAKKNGLSVLKKYSFENICSICGISQWNGKDIICEVHHIDGNNKNNSKDNLQVLCPNCHANTDTFRTKLSNRKLDK